MTSITIPKTIDDAAGVLGGLDELITAKEWHRAAIVAAFVELDSGHGGRKETRKSARFESSRAFARRGIHGLRSENTVARYAKAWLDKYARPTPGTEVSLPSIPFPPSDNPNFQYEEVKKRNTRNVLTTSSVDEVRDIVASLPPDAKTTLAEAVQSEPEARSAMTRATIRHHSEQHQRAEQRSREQRPGLHREIGMLDALAAMDKTLIAYTEALRLIREVPLDELEQKAMDQRHEQIGRVHDWMGSYLATGARGFDAELAALLEEAS